MVATPVKQNVSTDYSLEDWLQSPPEGTAWVNGEYIRHLQKLILRCPKSL
ncbi:hypothetical protein IQ259_15545 [Fortiea sp. LEGE XX443]|nr:hypothetical protein [Fortiea sp. LEGE XX443]MBE9006436.1 hypothetical protein [Fortiea sp. LEGE XX443]